MAPTPHRGGRPGTELPFTGRDVELREFEADLTAAAVRALPADRRVRAPTAPASRGWSTSSPPPPERRGLHRSCPARGVDQTGSPPMWCWRHLVTELLERVGPAVARLRRRRPRTGPRRPRPADGGGVRRHRSRQSVGDVPADGGGVVDAPGHRSSVPGARDGRRRAVDRRLVVAHPGVRLGAPARCRRGDRRRLRAVDRRRLGEARRRRAVRGRAPADLTPRGDRRSECRLGGRAGDRSARVRRSRPLGQDLRSDRRERLPGDPAPATAPPATATTAPMRSSPAASLRCSRPDCKPPTRATWRTVQVASVIGREFSIDVVAAVSGRSVADTDGALTFASRAGVVEDVDRSRRRFVHSLFHDATYATLDRSRSAPTCTRRSPTCSQRGPRRTTPDDLARIAGHLAAAATVQPDLVSRAVSAALAAADDAADQLAWDEAAGDARRRGRPASTVIPTCRPRGRRRAGAARRRTASGRTSRAAMATYASRRRALPRRSALLSVIALGHEDAYLATGIARRTSGDPSIELLERARSTMRAQPIRPRSSSAAAVARAYWFSGFADRARELLADIASSNVDADDATAMRCPRSPSARRRRPRQHRRPVSR